MGDRPEAVIFDLDGVITLTARVHAAAWKELFDNYLKQRAERFHESFRPFDANADYYTYVDGKPRYDGVLSFLNSRNIHIPYGSPSDPPSEITVSGLGNRKDELFTQRVQRMGVDVDHDAVRFVQGLRSRGVRTGLASSSRNAVLILEKAAVGHLFDAVVDGVDSERLHLRGKPEPDIFLCCLSRLSASTSPKRAAIVEDAISGVQAGRRGGFGLVLGIDRHNTGALKRNGADWAIRDFRQITVDQFVMFFNELARAA